MKKEELLEKLNAAWDAFQEAYAGLSEAGLLEPGVTGDWSIKEIIAHVTAWEKEALKMLPLIQKGQRPPRYKDLYGGIDAFNAQKAAASQSLSLSQVLQQAQETHQRLVDYIQQVPDELFTRDTPFRRRLRLDTYSHYQEHTSAIRKWRERRGL